MHLPSTLLLLFLTPVTSHPAPTPQLPEPILGLQCPNGPTCPMQMMTMTCQNGNLVCMLGNMVQVPIGKCADCAGSMCAGPSDAYPGEKRQKKTTMGEVIVVEREIVERQDSRCMAQWECACVAADGIGYYTRGAGKQCPVLEGAFELCDPQNGFLCIFGCRSELLRGFTNEKCAALFPGTRAVCKSY
ncbi:hypothetical protein B0H66DRAFT_558783 [Apodospora peruviana]|uniref:Uncharacterized protein n=1 Tax=Apodospora peruviana TaxID=516989 RepID=A0AAE0I7I8_9PEZI|nr:hypothetical protein B0H66DRAFT_558783 [Apodospora peruviana]